MATSPPTFPQPPENTGFIKELQWKENRSQDEFLGSLLTDDTLAKDHIALKHSQSSSSGSGKNAKKPAIKQGGVASKPIDDPDIYTQLSVNLWKRINAGYLIPRKPPTGLMKAMFTYDPNTIEPMSMEFHRKRDFYSEYNEAAARFKLVHGNKKPLSKPPRRPGGKGGADGKDQEGASSPNNDNSADVPNTSSNQSPMADSNTVAALNTSSVVAAAGDGPGKPNENPSGAPLTS